jgi:hypothetical protein
VGNRLHCVRHRCLSDVIHDRGKPRGNHVMARRSSEPHIRTRDEFTRQSFRQRLSQHSLVGPSFQPNAHGAAATPGGAVSGPRTTYIAYNARRQPEYVSRPGGGQISFVFFWNSFWLWILRYSRAIGRIVSRRIDRWCNERWNRSECSSRGNNIGHGGCACRWTNRSRNERISRISERARCTN